MKRVQTSQLFVLQVVFQSREGRKDVLPSIMPRPDLRMGTKETWVG